MEPSADDSPAGPMDSVARTTLAMAGFMLFLLISLPFALTLDGPTGYIAPYLIYSLFLTSVGIIIGISLTWLNDPRRQARPEGKAPEPKKPTKSLMLSDDQRRVVDLLAASFGSMWQAELVRESGFTDSKASRLLSRMEHEGLIRRVRDGMGKRVELMENGG